jgi:antitoxin ParD1/3/4
VSAAKKLHLSLEPELAERVDDAVASGAYASANEVVEDALRCWMERSALAADVDALKRLWREGIESGQSEALDMDDIKRAARARLLREEPDRS